MLVAPALPAKPEGFRRAMTAGQQLQSLARLALLRSDTAGVTLAAATLAGSCRSRLHVRCTAMENCARARFPWNASMNQPEPAACSCSHEALVDIMLQAWTAPAKRCWLLTCALQA